MANMLSDGVTWFSTQLETAAGEDCIYAVGEEEIGITVIPSKPQAMVDGQGTVLIDADALDFILDPAVLIFAAGLTAPAEGHKIKRWPQGLGLTYELRRPGTNMPVAEPADGYGVRVRVHGKLVDSE
ncbi:MAG: hypothetical protein PHU85_03935 [Phycisphaerae bacterium]|nr:hypothetical protein [Phycisphaerae bacterium]